jgi:hypothetical protein
VVDAEYPRHKMPGCDVRDRRRSGRRSVRCERNGRVESRARGQEALRSIARIAIREVALRSNTALPVEDATVIGNMTIDRLSPKPG